MKRKKEPHPILTDLRAAVALVSKTAQPRRLEYGMPAANAHIVINVTPLTQQPKIAVASPGMLARLLGGRRKQAGPA